MEDEYKKLFLYQKRWAKHWTTYSAHRAHSSTQWMREPAQETFDFICTLQKDMKQSPYSDKVIELYKFFCKKKLKKLNHKKNFGIRMGMTTIVIVLDTYKHN